MGGGSGQYGSGGGMPLYSQRSFTPTNQNPAFQNAMSYGNSRMGMMPSFGQGPQGQYGRSGSFMNPMPGALQPPGGRPGTPGWPGFGPPGGGRDYERFGPDAPGSVPPGISGTPTILGQSSQVNPAWQPGHPGGGGNRTGGMSPIPQQPQFQEMPTFNPGPQTGGGMPMDEASQRQAQAQGVQGSMDPGMQGRINAMDPYRTGGQQQMPGLMQPMDKPMQMPGMNPFQQNYNNVAGFRWR